MKANRLQTLWIMLMSALYMANTCGRATLKRWCGIITRTWCDEELQRWVQRMLRLLQITPKVINPHHVMPIPGQPTIIMCNHSSLFDIPLSLFAFPHSSVRMLAKKELGNIPIMGRGMIAAEFPMIDRKNRKQAIKDLKIMRQRLEDGIVTWVAPEGTRSKDGRLGAFKKGGFITAIQTGATIIPIGIRGAHRICPSKTFAFNLGETPEIHIGEPIDARAYTLKQKEVLMDKVFQSIQTLLGE